MLSNMQKPAGQPDDECDDCERCGRGPGHGHGRRSFDRRTASKDNTTSDTDLTDHKQDKVNILRLANHQRLVATRRIRHGGQTDRSSARAKVSHAVLQSPLSAVRQFQSWPSYVKDPSNYTAAGVVRLSQEGPGHGLLQIWNLWPWKTASFCCAKPKATRGYEPVRCTFAPTLHTLTTPKPEWEDTAPRGAALEIEDAVVLFQ
ncbi:hypothetical protein GE09DRAFT_782896 [Coniochaeta sp. 2T2.1]|nr:hypothetical protein GE09DRAFT_782896 [Coniochaeta sp. 2T2.1]